MKDLKRTVYFYALQDPLTYEVRYIGKTVQSLQIRLRRHINDPKGHVGNWIKKLQKIDLTPIAIEIGSCFENEDWQSLERMLIASYREMGYNLCNICDGGYGATNVKRSKVFVDAVIKRLSKKIYSFDKSSGVVREHKSLRSAAIELNLKESRISIALNQNKVSGNYLFSETSVFSQSERSKRYSRPIKCLHTDNSETEYRSSRHAAISLGLSASFIRLVAKGKYADYKGLKFSYK